MGRSSRPTESKTIDFYGLGFDETDGIVEAIVAVTGVVDRLDERVVRGSFYKTIKDHSVNFPKLPMGIDHEYGAGVTLDMAEVTRGDLPADIRSEFPAADGGLYCKGQTVMSDSNIALLKSINQTIRRGRPVFSSFVYDPVREAKAVGPGGRPIRDLLELAVNEWTIALRKAPVNPAARLIGVKAMGAGEAKAELDGSDEARREAIQAALQTALAPADGYVWVRGTFPTYVIAGLSGPGQPETYFRVEYAFVGQDVALGAATPVDLELTVSEKAVVAGELMSIVDRLTAEAKAGRVLRQALVDEVDVALQALNRIWDSVKSSTADTAGTAGGPDGDPPAAKAVEAADDEDLELEALTLDLGILESRAALAAIGG